MFKYDLYNYAWLPCNNVCGDVWQNLACNNVWLCVRRARYLTFYFRMLYLKSNSSMDNLDLIYNKNSVIIFAIRVLSNKTIRLCQYLIIILRLFTRTWFPIIFLESLPIRTSFYIFYSGILLSRATFSIFYSESLTGLRASVPVFYREFRLTRASFSIFFLEFLPTSPPIMHQRHYLGHSPGPAKLTDVLVPIRRQAINSDHADSSVPRK